MIDDTTAQGRHQLLSACDLWLLGRDVKIPSDFYGQMASIKRDAAGVADAAGLRRVTEDLRVLTGQLSPEDWKDYEERRGSSGAKELAAAPEPQRRLAINGRSAALKNF
jgi:hypothetical protein